MFLVSGFWGFGSVSRGVRRVCASILVVELKAFFFFFLIEFEFGSIHFVHRYMNLGHSLSLLAFAL